MDLIGRYDEYTIGSHVIFTVVDGLPAHSLFRPDDLIKIVQVVVLDIWFLHLPEAKELEFRRIARLIDKMADIVERKNVLHFVNIGRRKESQSNGMGITFQDWRS